MAGIRVMRVAVADLTALEAVMKVDVERERLEHEAEALALAEMTPEIEQRMDEVYRRLDEMGSDKAEPRAAAILHGLGFTPEMQRKKCRDFSGGWRMRISLARALYLDPTFLILDEPTNHLDLEACVWLEEKLKNFNKILLMVSHSQDFLNNVCTNIIYMSKKKCQYYSGNYDQFVITKMELDENQMKRFKWEQNQIADMKNYIARFGHGSAKLARQAQSKEKVLQKMVAGGLTETVSVDRGEGGGGDSCGSAWACTHARAYGASMERMVGFGVLWEVSRFSFLRCTLRGRACRFVPAPVPHTVSHPVPRPQASASSSRRRASSLRPCSSSWTCRSGTPRTACSTSTWTWGSIRTLGWRWWAPTGRASLRCSS